MKTIRHNTFETNSSSAHALIYTPISCFSDFQKGKMVLHMGGFGVPKSYLKGRGWQDDGLGGSDGKVLSWCDARDLYVESLKNEDRHFRQKYINFLKWHVRNEIRKPDDITTDDFKKAVDWGDDKNGSTILFGTWLNYKQWSKNRPDEYGNPANSSISIKGDIAQLDFWWFAG